MEQREGWWVKRMANIPILSQRFPLWPADELELCSIAVFASPRISIYSVLYSRLYSSYLRFRDKNKSQIMYSDIIPLASNNIKSVCDFWGSVHIIVVYILGIWTPSLDMSASHFISSTSSPSLKKRSSLAVNHLKLGCGAVITFSAITANRCSVTPVPSSTGIFSSLI